MEVISKDFMSVALKKFLLQSFFYVLRFTFSPHNFLYENLFSFILFLQVNEYEQFLIKQCGKMFKENRMVLICQSLSLKLYQQKETYLKFKRKGLILNEHENVVVR